MTVITAEHGEKLSLLAAREALAQEWAAASPETDDQIAAFYRDSHHMADELDAWHDTKSRKRWTEIATHVAGQVGAHTIIDIGCGAGHDLRALRAALGPDADLHGVEPNNELRAARDSSVSTWADVSYAPIERADMLMCMDVLEHLPDPETWLASWAGRARLGAVLIETTATFDVGTPLHLDANRGWHPGHVLEKHGWEVLDARGRLRVWQRMRARVDHHASVLLCAYRSCSIPTMNSLLKLQDNDWRITTKWSDGLISRARSILASRWWQETADDVFLMVDDDIIFEPEMAQRLVDQCRNGHDIICAAYPVRDGGHLAISGLDREIQFGPDEPINEIRWAAAGFCAVHRRVMDALMTAEYDYAGVAAKIGITAEQARAVLQALDITDEAMPLCHGNQPWAFKPLFQPLVVKQGWPLGHNYLSEDWAFCERARRAGFSVWLDPTIQLHHLAQVAVDVLNMDEVFYATRRQRAEDEEEENG